MLHPSLLFLSVRVSIALQSSERKDSSGLAINHDSKNASFPHLPVLSPVPPAPDALQQQIPWMLHPWVIPTEDQKDFISWNYVGRGGINTVLLACCVGSAWLLQGREIQREVSQGCLNLGESWKIFQGGGWKWEMDSSLGPLCSFGWSNLWHEAVEGIE